MTNASIQETFGKHVSPRSGWEDNFTNPSNNPNENFCYLVHGLPDPFRKMTYQMELTSRGSFDAAHNIDLNAQPWRVNEKTVLSTSVVTHDRRATYGKTGLILKAPFDNIIDMGTSDLGTNIFNPHEAANKTTGTRCYTPLELARLTGPTRYNEVSLRGNSDAGHVEVIGIFFKVDPNGNPTAFFGVEEKKLALWGLTQDCPVIPILNENYDPADIKPGFYNPPFMQEVIAQKKTHIRYDDIFKEKAALFAGGHFSEIYPGSID